MTDAILIGLWAHLFTGPMSEPDKVFGWLKAWCYDHLPTWAFLPLVGCAACHAGQVALWLEIWHWHNGEGFRLWVVLCAMFTGILFDDFAQIRERWKY